MEKPITVMRQEFTEKLVEVINTSGLPAFIMREVVGGLYKELQRGEEEQLRNDMAAWEQAKKESTKDEDSNAGEEKE